MPICRFRRLSLRLFVAFVFSIAMSLSIMATFALTLDRDGDNIASMNIAKFQPETVASFLKRRKIAMLGEIGEAIGNASAREPEEHGVGVEQTAGSS